MQFEMDNDGTHRVVVAPLPPPTSINDRPPCTTRGTNGRRGGSSGGRGGRGNGGGGRGGFTRSNSGGRRTRAPETVNVFSSIPNFERSYTSYVSDDTSASASAASSSSSSFRIVSFNVLADYLANSPDGNLAHSHPTQAFKFKWPFRNTRLLREMLTWHASILCLQEVDHFDDFFDPELRKYGYVGYHKQRTGATTLDGCSIFVKEELFDVVQVVEVNMNQPEHDAILDRDNVALVLVLTHKPTNETIAVANTHILFNPRRGDVKLAQLQLLFETLRGLDTTQIVLCGDFNLTPKSALYSFVSTGVLDGADVATGDASGQYANGYSYFHNDVHKEADADDDPRHQGAGTAAYRYDPNGPNPRQRGRSPAPQDCLGIHATHELALRSAYAQHPTDETTGEPFATSYHDRFLGTVDYIWYSNLQCMGVVELPEVAFFRNIRAMPTRDLSSDHLSLVADFSFGSAGDPVPAAV
ncbi:Aste57867_15484 [Aphanomyces stellatus]|uniref:Aste57867_15484 protein n=1 Tax=Aphanomyces stellatus TaxID=120398 RepID=A0A485L3T9_9STRA|nr:hypothetical protein As57867_015428 [Aphanomyces stellatus]VFT92286.1 Aste57867_15484 [Aphanomyces stellatus]